MSKVVRQSKFRHVYGQALKRDQGYDNIRITKSSWDSTYCSVNPKYLAVITEAAGGGSFLVLPIEKVGRVDREAPMVVGHTAAVLDLQWCPHDDSIIASGSEDCTVKVWQIPEGGLTESMSQPVVDLVAHQRRVGLVVWHPTAHNILLSGGSDNKVIIWNIENSSIVSEVGLPEVPWSASWSWNGASLVVSCRDKKVRVVEPRKGQILQEQTCHEGGKATQVCYLKDNRILTTGFSKRSERQVSLWNEKLENLNTVEIDNSNGVLYISYDPDTGIVFLCGKGDSMMRYFEVTDHQPFIHYLNSYSSSNPQRGVAFMPKRGLNVNICEIARYYKVHTKGLCEVIPMTVPRKSELFQDDLYPDTAGDEPALTAEAWISGKDATPIMVSLKDGYVSKKKEGFSGGFMKASKGGSDELLKEVQQLKEQLKLKDEEISELKTRLQNCEN